MGGEASSAVGWGLIPASCGGWGNAGLIGLVAAEFGRQYDETAEDVLLFVCRPSLPYASFSLELMP
jgi:hypothetical protein